MLIGWVSNAARRRGMGAMLLAAAVTVGSWPGAHGGCAKPNRVGSIFIQGNVQTADNHILDVVHESGLYPAWPLPNVAEFLWVEIRLLVRFHDQFPWAAGM